jgi:lysophospholipase L1-like esterase
MSRASGSAGKLLLLVASSALTLAAFEAGLRVTGSGEPSASDFLGDELATPGLFLPDRRLFWRLDPACKSFDVSPSSTRGPCPDWPPESTEYRIACVGDSCAFGLGVRFDQCFAVRLARALQTRTPGSSVEPVLVACPGYSTLQSLRWFEQLQPSLRPDLTILYCGAWNDYVPAVERSDEQFAEATDAGSGELALLRLLGRAAARVHGPSRAERIAAFRRGDAPHGRRVPLAEFREHLRDLVRVARRSSEAVVVVVPPLPDETTRSFPIALEYRDALIAVAREESAPLVDAPGLFERAIWESPAGPLDPSARSSKDPRFTDWVHPSALGHRIIAEELLRTVVAAPPAKLRAALPRSALAGEPRASLRAFRPARVPALQVASLTLEDASLPRGRERIGLWVGECWIESSHVVELGPSELRVEVPARLPAGRHFICCLGRRGLIAAAQPLEVTPLSMHATLLDRDEARLRIALETSGPPNCLVRIWGAPARRGRPAPTPFGEFAIGPDTDGWAEGEPDPTFRFESLRLALYLGKTDDAGRWRGEIDVPVALVHGLEAILFQGVVTRLDDLTVGSVTEVAELRRSW